MKKLLLLFTLLIFGLASCSKDDDPDPSITDEGVVINGVRWATRNVDAPGTFAQTPADPGMLFQWNCRIGWSATDPLVSSPVGREWGRFTGGTTGETILAWARSNDPCPPGWRVPTHVELESLLSAIGEWTTQPAVGRVFRCGNNILFLPATATRNWFGNRELDFVGLPLLRGFFWSSERRGGVGTDVWSLGIESKGVFMAIRSPFFGHSVRCVAE